MPALYWIKAEDDDGADRSLLVGADSPSEAMAHYDAYLIAEDWPSVSDPRVHLIPGTAAIRKGTIPWDEILTN